MKGSTHSNDNNDTWISLSAATERALERGGKLFEQQAAGAVVSGASFLGSTEETKMNLFPIDDDRCAPRVDGAATRADTFKARGIVLEKSPVELVLRAICLAKIAKPVVETIAINVVNLDGPIAVNVKPYDPVQKMVPTEYPYVPVAVAILAAGNPVEGSPSPANFPSDGARFREVGQMRSYQFGSKHMSPRAKDEQKGGNGDADAGNTDEQRANEHRRYVDHRLRETAEFERRVSGIKKRKV